MAIDLKRFCANETDSRDYLRAPWRDGDWVYATNGHMALRVAASLFPEVTTKPEKAPDVGRLFRKHLEDRQGLEFLVMPPVPGLIQCFDCEGTGKVRAIKCPDCDEGTFKHGEWLYDCKNCDGSAAGAGWEELQGHVPTQPHEVLRPCLSCDGIGFSIRQHGNMAIGESTYSVVYLAMFAGLPQVRICPGDPAPDALSLHVTPAVFTFDGGHGILMPRSN